MNSRALFFFSFFISLGFCGCSSDESNSPLERAAGLSSSAKNLLQQNQFSKAEQFFIEASDILRKSNNFQQYNEMLTQLAPLQMQLGKYSSALEHFQTLRAAADQSNELQTMLTIGYLEWKLGRTEKALQTLNKTSERSQLLTKYDIAIQAKLRIAEIYLTKKNYSLAERELNEAAVIAQRINQPNVTASIYSALGITYTKNGDDIKAIQFFSKAEKIYLHSPSIESKTGFYLHYGNALSEMDDDEAALQCFRYVLRLEPYNLHALNGIAEIYFSNFDFASAEKYLLRIYERSRETNDNFAAAFSSIRLGDCSLKEYGKYFQQKDVILAQQRYEQAHTIFARNNFPAGEAIVVARLAALKELQRDNTAAIALYKRAYELLAKFNVQEFQTALILFSPESKQHQNSKWIAARLIALLLQQNRFEEAYSYYRREQESNLHNHSLNYSFTVHEQEQQKFLADFYSLSELLTAKQSELLLQTQIEPRFRSRDFSLQNSNGIVQLQNKLAALQKNIAAQFPQMHLLTASHLPQSIQNFIPDGTVLFDYCFIENQAWVFISRFNKPIEAVKFSSFGNSLIEKIKIFIQLLSDNSSVNKKLQIKNMSAELYGFLLQPVEAYIDERCCIVVPADIAQLPFHALTKNGKPVIDIAEISYLPASSFILSIPAPQKMYQSITALGFAQESKWGLEFELRELRSYFRTSSIFVNQQATKKNLFAGVSSALQLSTIFSINENSQFQFVLSSGNNSVLGAAQQVSTLAQLQNFSTINITNIAENSFAFDSILPITLFSGKTSNSVINLSPVSSKLNKRFNEYYYSTLSSTNNAMQAYRFAVRKLSTEKEFSDDFSWASYFYFGK